MSSTTTGSQGNLANWNIGSPPATNNWNTFPSTLQPGTIVQVPVWTTQSVVWHPQPRRYTRFRVTSRAVVLEGDDGSTLEIDLDVLRRLMRFDEIEALAALEALRE